MSAARTILTVAATTAAARTIHSQVSIVCLSSVAVEIVISRTTGPRNTGVKAQ